MRELKIEVSNALAALVFSSLILITTSFVFTATGYEILATKAER